MSFAKTDLQHAALFPLYVWGIQPRCLRCDPAKFCVSSFFSSYPFFSVAFLSSDGNDFDLHILDYIVYLTTFFLNGATSDFLKRSERFQKCPDPQFTVSLECVQCANLPPPSNTNLSHVQDI
eukprot:EG_transcript_22160